MLDSDISIIVQGPLNHGNAEQIASHCVHWRQLFPECEIILSISSTDISNLHNTADNLYCNFTYEFPSSATIRAISTLNGVCNKFALLEISSYLPQIKSDKKASNNVNYQILSAQRGISLASKKYVLRIRNDCLLLSKIFLEEYEHDLAFPRLGRTVFKKRVMIPSIYTLNPYSRERMPFHYSDWFHFGLREDVAQIWDIPQYSLADSVHYIRNAHAPHSNSHERRFLTRLAVEQYISFSCFSKNFDDIILEYHNDLRSIQCSLDVLCDNFIVCDAEAVDLYFPKYQSDISDQNNISKCISSYAWKMLCTHRGTDYEHIINSSISPEKKAQTFQEISYRPLDFLLRDSRLSCGKIENTNRNGLLAYGPYIDLEPGCYRCRFSFSEIRGLGRLHFSVTSNAGATNLFRKNLWNWRKRTTAHVVFDIKLVKSETNVEFLIKYNKIDRLVFTGFHLKRVSF